MENPTELEIPSRIRKSAERLKEGRKVNRITVRDFLGHFGAERRGAVKVEAIRRILDFLDLQTEPDFETVWIDEPIRLRLKDGILTTEPEGPDSGSENGPLEADVEENVLESTPSAVEQAMEQSESAPTSAEPSAPEESADAESSDPIFRIGSLPAANQRLVAVNRDDSIATAITLMLENQFSQLPVMQGEREVKGVVTWRSIACWQARQSVAPKCGRVADCREDARIVDSNRTLFDVIPVIIEYGYVLVRQRDRRISGIVTASDLSEQFHALAEPFLLLREIELHVRRLIGAKIPVSDLDVLGGTVPSIRTPQSIADFTFGEYIRLFQLPQIWDKLHLNIDRSVLTTLLEKVRLIRNDVMHFDPDPMTPDELRTLKRAARFMQEHHELLQ
jgi:predicted transcriptional regulator